MSLTCPHCGHELGLVLNDLGVNAAAQNAAQNTAEEGLSATVALAQDPYAQKILGSSSEAGEAKPSSRKGKYDYKDPGFQAFWEVYPLKRGKAAAYRRWQQVTAQGIASAALLAAATAYRDDPRRDPEFTKWPEGWLQRGGWDDVLTVEAPPRSVSSVDQDFDFQAQQAARWAEEDEALRKLVDETFVEEA